MLISLGQGENAAPDQQEQEANIWGNGWWFDGSNKNPPFIKGKHLLASIMQELDLEVCGHLGLCPKSSFFYVKERTFWPIK